MITLQLKPGVSRRLSTNIDLTDFWTKIEIRKSPELFATDYNISFALDEKTFLRKEFVQAQSLVLNISNLFGNVVSEKENLELQITNVGASQLGRMGLMGNPDLLRTMVTVNAMPIEARASRDIIGVSFLTNPSARTVLNYILGGLGAEVDDPLPISFTQVFIPTTYRVNAFSYLVTGKGIYDSPTFYIHEDKGIYVYTLKDSLKRPNRFKVVYGLTKTASSKLDAYSLLTSRVIVSPNDAYIQYQVPSKINISTITHKEFTMNRTYELSTLPFSPYGSFQPSLTPSQRISGEAILTSGSNSGGSFYSKYSYDAIGNLTLIVLIDELGRFKDLRPGMAIDFKTDIDEAHAGLNGTYLLKEVNALFEKKGNEIIRDMRLVLQRYGIEYR
jgi:hypothetical protein